MRLIKRINEFLFPCKRRLSLVTKRRKRVCNDLFCLFDDLKKQDLEQKKAA